MLHVSSPLKILTDLLLITILRTGLSTTMKTTALHVKMYENMDDNTHT